MKDHFQREMGGTERMRLRFPNINVLMTARIQGNITAQDIKKAVQKAREKHPLLGSRVAFDQDGKGYYRTEGVPDNQIQIVPRQDDQEWLEVTRRQLQLGWDIEQGPLVRFVLLHSPSVSDLVVNAHHSVCDGRSLAYLISDLLFFMANPDQEVKTICPVPLDEAVPASARGGFFYKLMMKMMNKKWLKRDQHFDQNDFEKLQNEYWQARTPALMSWSLDKDQTSRLVARCKLENVSVNSAIYTAFLSAQEEHQDTTQDYYRHVMVPVDFRRYLDTDVSRALGLYSSAVMFSFQYQEGDSIWDNARRLDQEARKQLTEKNIFGSQKTSLMDPTFFDGIALAMFGYYQDEMAREMAGRMRDKVRTGVLVSNLGRLQLPTKYKHLTLEWIKPPAIYGENAEKNVEVLTIGGRLHFMISCGEIGPSQETLEKMLGTAREIMSNIDLE